MKYFIFFLLFINITKCEQERDEVWDKQFASLGGHHQYALVDSLKYFGICKKQDNAESCYKIVILLYDTVNSVKIQIKNSSFHSNISFTLKDQTITLTASETSKKITLYYDPVGQYKILTAENGTVVNDSNYNFRTGTFNDGVIIRENGILKNDLELDGCNIFDIEQGKIIQGQCLTPTGP